jgi:hypothetical protein
MVSSMELVLHALMPTVSLAIMAFVPIVLLTITQAVVRVLHAQMATIQVLAQVHAQLALLV